MRKFIGVLLSVLCICCAAIGLIGCKKDKHIHTFDKQVITDEYKATDVTCTEAATYYYSCKCGEKGTETFGYGSPLGHSFTNYVSDNNATCTEDGTKTAVCDRDGCNAKDTVTDTGSKLPHTFDKQVANEKYLASAATCTEKAKYYYSCKCGATGIETFEYGNPLGHSFTNYVSDNNATYKKDGTKTAHCNRNGCTATDTIPDENSKLESKITFKTLTVGEKNTDGNVSVYGKVPNAQKTYSFIDEIETEGVARFVVSMDVYGMHTVVTKTIPLSEGDNKIFVIELNGEDVKSIYEVTIRRRPMYSVVFDTNGGTILDSRQIEEGTVITAPETTKAGYTFIEWDYDFTQPITQNITIKATWSANTNTAYKVEYYLENIDDADYSLYETSNLQGTTDTTATAEIKTYDHFTFYKNNSILSGNVSGDGSLVLKVYYTRSTYTLSNANTSYGEITNAATKKYGSEIDSVATEYLGCGFLGWYNGEELLSTAREYTFTIETNVTAKFKIKDEMSNFNFNSSVDTCNITGLKDKTVSKIIVPDYVTSIGGSAFSDCSGLTSVTIPDSVTSIGDCAFWYCSGLASITIGSGVTSIGSSAFRDCSGLTSVTIPDSVTSIGSGAFLDCSRLTSVIWNAENCTTEGSYWCPIFSNCSLLTKVTIGENVKMIPDYAFYGCSGLTSVTIPNSVTSIGDSAFRGCSGLTSVTISGSVTSIGDSAFFGCSGLTSVTIPNSVTSIGDGAFYGCSRLTSVTIPDSVTSIGNSAFGDCSGLTSVTIPDSVTSIGGYAFSECSGLTSVTIPDSVTSIGELAFSGCSGLTSITIPDSVTSIGDGAFGGCSGIESLVVTTGNKKYHSANNCIIETETKKLIIGCKNSVIPTDDGVTSIGYQAFYYCSGLTSVTIPNSVTSIGDGAFYGCSGLTSVTIPDSVTSIGKYAFSACSGLTSVTIPDSVTSIGERAFLNCSGLTNVIIGNSVTSIGDSAFMVCSGIESLVVTKGNKKYHSANNCIIETGTRKLIVGCKTSIIPSDGSVTSIGSSAFRGCSSLTSVTIPDSVTSIGSSAFRDCSGLTSVIIGNSVTSIDDSAFIGCSGLTSVTIPDSVTSIGDSAFMDCSGLTSVIIGNSVTSIGNSAFIGCSGLTSITIPNSVTSIGDGAFGDCSGLTSVTIPNSVTSIGNYVFYGCSGLTSVTIPNSVTSIGSYAFRGCSGLTSVTISDSVTYIGYYAFSGCRGLTSVTIGNSVTSIGDGAFYGCSGLTSVTIPDSVTSIGKYAFSACSGLTSVTIGNGVTSIGDYAFRDCNGLTSVTIPGSVTSIGSYAFRDCSGLKNITYTGTIADWQNIDKGSWWNDNVSTDCVIHCTDGDIKLFK